MHQMQISPHSCRLRRELTREVTKYGDSIIPPLPQSLHRFPHELHQPQLLASVPSPSGAAGKEFELSGRDGLRRRRPLCFDGLVPLSAADPPWRWMFVLFIGYYWDDALIVLVRRLSLKNDRFSLLISWIKYLSNSLGMTWFREKLVTKVTCLKSLAIF